MQFLAKEYGGRNVVHAIAHHDETSPHLHAIVVPIKTKIIRVGRKVKTERKEERLCCRDWLGGDRKTLSKLQTRFADQVKELGLSRGIEGSQAKHNRVSQFYTLMNETVEQAQAIHQALPQIDPDYYVRSVAKPNLLERAQPYKFAQAQVGEALSALRQQIEQTNQNARTARQGQLVKLQSPVQSALQQKSQVRESQAEAALKSLGYRLDQYGQLVNILEERKQALRATISATVPKCTSLEELSAGLAKKGVKMGFHKERFDEQDGLRYNQVGFGDGKGPRIGGDELGPDYTTFGLLRQLEQVRQARERQEREKEYARHYDQVLAKALKDHKGDCRQTADYLKALSEPAREQFYQGVAKQLGAEAGEYFRRRLETDRQKTPLQLSADREYLRSLGLNVGSGRQQNQSQKQGT